METKSTQVTINGIHKFDVYNDGSGISGVVDAVGWRYAANYVNGEPSITLITQRAGKTPPKWLARTVRSLVQEVADMQTDEWHEMHRAMYAEDAQ